MLEFVLFHQKPVQLFESFLKDLQILPTICEDDGIFMITIPDNMSDETSDKVENYYDELMAMNKELFFAEHDATRDNYQMATVMVTLEDGQTSSAHVRPELINQILDAISEEEMHEFVAAIAKAVEHPDERSYCQKVRAGDIDFNAEG